MSRNISTSDTQQSQWNISTDIYQIVQNVDNLKARYVGDEDETTLALGIFGFLGDTEAKKIQTATIMTGELGNEMFPARAKLDKNVLTHAIYCNIEGINATPAELTIRVGIKEEDLDNYMENDTFIFDRTNPIFIGKYEFHFDYDILLKRNYVDVGTNNEHKVYTALYRLDNDNEISTITNPYLMQPIVQNFNNYRYIFFTATVHQCSIIEVEDKMITDSIIDNKSFTFNFSNQLANFEVYVTDNGKTTRLKPYFYGSSIDQGVTKYCWYLYINDTTVRVGFDPNSFIPGLNATVRIVAYTTLGAGGNFSYDTNNANAIYVDFSSVYTNSKKITCFINCATDSRNGSDKKSTAELRGLIPKMAMSRGYITTETDLNNYFNLISTDDNRLQLQKKVDNQLERIWYAYFVLKDMYKNIVPTNTVQLKINLEDGYALADATGSRFIVPCGTTFVYDKEKGYAEVIDESEIPTPFTDAYFDDKTNLFYYKSIYNLVLNLNPLYAAYYMTIVNNDSYFEYEYVNESAPVGFAAVRNHIERSLLSRKDEYRFSFTMTQSINEDYHLFYDVVTDQETGRQTCSTNVKCILVIHQNNEPYRYAIMDLDQDSFDQNDYSSRWEAVIKTDNTFDTKNKIKLLDLYEVGYNSRNYGFFDDNCEAYVYIAAKFEEKDKNGEDVVTVYTDENLLLSKICPGFEDYSLLNVYKVADGMDFFNNFTNLMNTRVRVNQSDDGTVTNYDIFGVPLVGEHYFDNSTTFPNSVRSIEDAEDAVTYLMKALAEKKDYIRYCLRLVENNMDIDFKLFNTYGPSKTYTIGINSGVYLNRIDIKIEMKVKLVNSSDLATRDSIIEYIKEYVENLNDLGDLHFSNLLHDIKHDYNEAIEYIDYITFNGNDLGINHIELEEPDDPHIVPEFINVRNKYAADGETLVPCITVEIVL